MRIVKDVYAQSKSRWLVMAACLLLALARVLGLHLHLVDHDHDDLPLEALPALTQAVADSEAAHLQEHLQGDVDVDVPAVAGARLLLWPPVLLFACLAIASSLVLVFVKAIVRPPLRPPRPRHRRDLMPPSQAPPLAA